jgi:hypothetical protein
MDAFENKNSIEAALAIDEYLTIDQFRRLMGVSDNICKIASIFDKMDRVDLIYISDAILDWTGLKGGAINAKLSLITALLKHPTNHNSMFWVLDTAAYTALKELRDKDLSVLEPLPHQDDVLKTHVVICGNYFKKVLTRINAPAVIRFNRVKNQLLLVDTAYTKYSHMHQLSVADKFAQLFGDHIKGLNALLSKYGTMVQNRAQFDMALCDAIIIRQNIDETYDR